MLTKVYRRCNKENNNILHAWSTTFPRKKKNQERASLKKRTENSTNLLKVFYVSISHSLQGWIINSVYENSISFDWLEHSTLISDTLISENENWIKKYENSRQQIKLKCLGFR